MKYSQTWIRYLRLTFFWFFFGQGSILIGQNYDTEYQIANQAIQYLKTQQMDSLIKKFSPQLRSSTTNEGLHALANSAYRLISVSKFPEEHDVMSKGKTSQAQTSNSVFDISYPFTYVVNEVEDTKFINKNISHKLIQSISIDNFAFAERQTKSINTTGHLQKHDLDRIGVYWFRFWYGNDEGVANERSKNKYYEKSGGPSQLKKFKAEGVVEKIFKLINEAPIDSVDFNYLKSNQRLSEDYIYLRFKIDYLPYSKLDELQVFCYLRDKKEVEEGLKDYIVVKHSKQTRYLYEKEKNQELFRNLRALAYQQHKKIKPRKK